MQQDFNYCYPEPEIEVKGPSLYSDIKAVKEKWIRHILMLQWEMIWCPAVGELDKVLEQQQ